MDEVTVRIDADMAIAKADRLEQIVFGWGSVVAKADGTPIVDHQDDYIDIEDLEKAVYDFNLEWRGSGDSHDGNEPDGMIVESMVFTPEKLAKMGIPEGSVPLGWWIGVKIPDADEFAKVVSGERASFSIEGTALREPIELENASTP